MRFLSLLSAAVMLVGCADVPELVGAARATGSLALSDDDSRLFALDTELGELFIINAADLATLQRIKVGREPARMVSAAGGLLFISDRGGDEVVVVNPALPDRPIVARLPTGIEPSGLAVSPDGNTVYVVSGTGRRTPEQGTLTAFDVPTLTEKWTVAVGQEPRAVAAVAGGQRLLVAHFKSGEVWELSAADGRAVQSGEQLDVHRALNASSFEGTRRFFGSPFHQRGMTDLVVAGERVFAPAVLAREDPIQPRPAPGGYYGGGGPCSVGAVATAGLLTFAVGPSSTSVRADDVTECGGVPGDPGFPATVLGGASFGVSPDSIVPVQGTTAGLVDGTGQYLFLLNRESRNLVVLNAARRGDILNAVTVDPGADGLALPADRRGAFVYSQFTHTVQRIDVDDQDPQGQFRISAARTLASGLLPADLAHGRRLFFDAVDTKMSAINTRVACATCHLEGRDDGHTWSFPDGPRQTPTLAGRFLLETAPFHWNGEFSTIEKFSSHTIVERMGGTGLSASDAALLDAYIASLPRARTPQGDAAAVARGQEVFEKASCQTCHRSEGSRTDLLTNNRFADVGTRVALDVDLNPSDGVAISCAGLPEGSKCGFNVPSLHGLGRSAPYLHTGTEETLADVVSRQGTRHGNMALLTPTERQDLLAYLQTL
jgi:mono/diheme cytochrome c family protein